MGEKTSIQLGGGDAYLARVTVAYGGGCEVQVRRTGGGYIDRERGVHQPKNFPVRIFLSDEDARKIAAELSKYSGIRRRINRALVRQHSEG